MTRIIAICLVAALGWAGFWGLSIWRLSGATETWFDARRADGWTAQYDDLNIGGFPSRLDRTFRALRLGAPDAPVWRFDRIGIFQLTYRPDHLIMAADGVTSVQDGARIWTVDSEGLRASLVREDGALLRANAEAEVLNIAGPGAAFALADLRAALQQTTPDAGQVTVFAGRVISAGNTRAGRDLGLDMRMTWDGPLEGQVVDGARRPTDVDLRLAQYTLDDLKIEATGTLRLDPQGRPDGRLDLRAVNWREFLSAAVAAGQLPAELEGPLAQGLALWAGLQGNPQTLDIPLEFRRGQMAIGPVTFGNEIRLW